MNPETFFDNFGMLADVPDGVSKLRGLILQLAVQGKLVPQDENDEPASVLLGKIKAEKERLVKEKKIRKPKPVSSNDVENLYELPANWIWTRLFDIGIINPRNKASDNIDASFVPMTLISETYSTPVSSERRQWGEIKTGFTHFAEEDVVLAKITPCFQNGKSAVMRNLLNGFGAGTTELHVFRPLLGESVYQDYVLLYLKSPQFLTEGIEKMTGTAGQKRVTRDYFAGNPFPLPPFEEQKRIVVKADQLMALCDELEARQEKKQETRLHLNSAALDKLLTAHEPAEFANHWQRICDNFDLLYDNPETVGELRKAILQLAVQGRLVRQDPNDEPAAVLLEKIRVEKERLVKEGKIRKQKIVPPVECSDGLFELPESWQWDRFANVILSSEAGWSPQCEAREREGNEWGVLKVSAVSWDVFKPHENKALPSKLEPRPQHEVKVGDFLLSRANTLELVAKSVVVEHSPPKLMMSDKLIRLHLSEDVERRFFNIFNNCSIARGYYAKEASGTSSSMRNVSRECILKMPVPVPPGDEQKRIVARVNELMALCDDLESKLKQSQTDGAKLMEAVVHKIVAA